MNATIAFTLIDRVQHDTTVTLVYREVMLPTMSAVRGKSRPLLWP